MKRLLAFVLFIFHLGVHGQQQGHYAMSEKNGAYIQIYIYKDNLSMYHIYMEACMGKPSYKTVSLSGITSFASNKVALLIDQTTKDMINIYCDGNELFVVGLERKTNIVSHFEKTKPIKSDSKNNLDYYYVGREHKRYEF